MKTKICPHTLLNCGMIGTKCSECWLSDVWCAEAERYFKDMLEENPRTVINQNGENCTHIKNCEVLNL